MRQVLAFLTAWTFLSGICTPAVGADALADAIALREQGQVQQSIELLKATALTTNSPLARAQVAGELGISQLQARDLDHAATSLSLAHAYFTGAERARFAIHLGNLNARRKLTLEAIAYYKEAQALSGGDPAITLSAGLNMAAMVPENERLARLQTLSAQLGNQALPVQHLNLAHQAAGLTVPDLRLAYQHAERARELALRNGNRRLQVEAEELLGGLYESRERLREALALTQQALAHAHATDLALVADLIVALEWRQARLQQRLGANDAALAAYERAVNQLKAIRDDIPIENDHGRSSYWATISPLYLGYAAMLLQGAESQVTLRRVVDAMEQVKQAELQDYLGDRCIVQTIQGGVAGPVARGTALLYPIIFPDRIELLLETSTGITRRTTLVASTTVTETANRLAFSLRNGMNDFMPASRQVHDWLLAPFSQQLAGEAITTLVLVPDGALRLLPIAVLHDGQRFVIENYAVATVTGMTMTNGAAPRGSGAALVVGVSDPGPAVGKLSEKMASAILQPSSTRSLTGQAHGRSLRALPANADAASRGFEQLRASLQLPGVKQEVDALATVLHGRQLLNAQFTVDQFRRETDDSDYRIIHVASHGVFGGTTENSFIMAYDDLLTMDGLQAILKTDRYTRAPLELLSLSACETAEGNDRAPLGMAGAAMKARAKSVLGTLWPLEDNAAQAVMTRFYSGLTNGKLSKAEALRQAQLSLIKDANSGHPFFWGSFILIGNWQ
jgi:CHAT domain-containing protein